MSLNNLCFNHIKDYKVKDEIHSFYFGKLGEFNLVIDKNTGFFNATKLCKQGNKQYSHWFQLKRTKDLLTCIKNYPGDRQGNFVYEIKAPNNVEINKEFSGTYVTKELILDIASWISPEFYLKCNDIIIKHFEYEYQKTLSQKDDKIDELIKTVNQMKISHEEKINELLELNYEMNDKLDVAVEERAPFPEEESKIERFILIKREDNYYPYYAIRAQDKNAALALSKQKKICSDVKVILEFKTHPNTKTLYTRIKLSLRKQGVIFTRNDIRFKEDATIDEHGLVEAMKKIDSEKTEF